MSCQTLSALTHLLTEVNESVEEWKESSHKMEKNRDYWRKRAMDLEKKLYCKQCLSQQKEVEDLNDAKVKDGIGLVKRKQRGRFTKILEKTTGQRL